MTKPRSSAANMGCNDHSIHMKINIRAPMLIRDSHRLLTLLHWSQS